MALFWQPGQVIRLFTIGFAGKSAQQFFGLLQRYHVLKVIDTRRNPSSQLSGFAKQNDLRYFLGVIDGIEYEYREDFAPSAQLLSEYRKKHFVWEEYARRYTEEIAQRKVEQLNPETLHHACLLCSEHEPHYCHRRLLAEYFAQKFPWIEITHLVE